METTMTERIFLALGSNLGNREENLKKAREEISKIAKIVKPSSIYETTPVGYKEQPKFYNQVIEIQTALAPEILMQECLKIEIAMGRQRTIKDGPRNVDIDLLLYGKRIIKTPALTIPHPRMHERAFVLLPFAEIAKEVVHPEKGVTISALKDKISEEIKNIIMISDKHR